jgi:UDP-N-acetylmuramoyl-L-alanyl-D-glutamate--2,6-diaminopimelate ligase
MPSFELLAPTSPVGSTLDELRNGPIALSLEGSGQIRVTSVSVSSRELTPGGLFAALPGRNGHGADHALQAAGAGAAAILTDPAGADAARLAGLPLLIADDPRSALGGISAAVYGTAEVHPVLFAVTGTNGKTSTVHLLDALLTHLRVRSGRSSTADRKSGETVVASRLTTPESSELHALLARMNEDGVRAAALEVSAQALTRHRVDALVFDVAGFTNLSHDHRDDYPAESDYLAAKLALFHPARARRGVVLLDSPAGRDVRDRSLIPVTTVTSLDDVAADWRVAVVGRTATTTRFTLTGPLGQQLASSIPLLGRHMAADCALAIVMLLEAGYDFSLLARAIANGVSVTVPGRTDLVSGPEGPRVYLDFSHTPDSIEKALAAVRAITPGRVVVIVGADGDRDPSKRQPMGRAAAEGADVVIVTDHHPRFEDPAGIREALVHGATLVAGASVVEIPDPARAVRAALRLAGATDSVLWVGPGQTDYRVVRGRDVPYSPRADARLALSEAGWPSDVGELPAA